MAEPLLIVFGLLLMVFGIAIWLGMLWGYIYFFYPHVAKDIADFLSLKIYRPTVKFIVYLWTLKKKGWMKWRG